jgi:energy-coupling factor transport system permease protein
LDSLDIITFVILLSFISVIWVLGRISLRDMAVIIKLLSLVFLIFTLINGFMYFRGRTPLFYFLGYPFTIEGLFFGITLSLKVLTIVSTVPVLTKTTTMTDLISALARLHIPYQLIFILTTAMNFTDVIEETYNNIKESQFLRGYSLDEMNFLKRAIKGYAPIFIPLILTVLRKASITDLAIEARAFGATKNRTYVTEIRFRASDIFMIIVIIGLTVSLLIYNILYGTIIFILPT